MSTSQQRHQKKLRRASIKKGRGKRPAQSPDTTIGSEAQHHYKRAGSLREQDASTKRSLVSARQWLPNRDWRHRGIGRSPQSKPTPSSTRMSRRWKGYMPLPMPPMSRECTSAFGLGSAFEDLAQYQKSVRVFSNRQCAQARNPGRPEVGARNRGALPKSPIRLDYSDRAIHP